MYATGFARRRFLGGNSSPADNPIRPPGSLAEADFQARCTRCLDCVPACPEGIVRRGSGGFPEIDFHQGGCSFCGRCAEACREQAIVGSDALAWAPRPEVGDACLARQKVVCRTCGEACEERAIRFKPSPGGVARPEVDSERCTGCGQCVAPCPTGAIRMVAPVADAEERQ